MTPRRAISVLALVSYLAAVLLFPVLHRLHHLAHGADHVHTAAGTIYQGPHHHDHDDDDDDDDDEPALDLAHYHAQFDHDVVTLGLADVATAGALTIDCAYARFSLATCDESATADHPRTFGDDLLARTHPHHDHAPEGTDHGNGSLEHSQASYLCSTPVALPPPTEVLAYRELLVRVDVIHVDPRVRPPIRGPPSAT